MDEFYELFDSVFMMEAEDGTHIMRDNLYPKIEAVLKTPVGDKKFKHIVGSYIDRHSSALYKAGPMELIPYADNDKTEMYNLFNITEKEVKDLTEKVITNIPSSSDFKLLKNNPIFWVLYCCIRFYTLKKDEKGVHTALAIYACAVYPSIFSLFFKYGVNEAVMQYTMDNLSKKFTFIKSGGNLFSGLMTSITSSYTFLKPNMKDASDKEMIRFIQRIRNDQKSMIKNVCDQYMQNHAKGLRVNLTKDAYDEIAFDDQAENNTSVVEVVSNNITNKIITNGIDIRRVSQCKTLADISLADCRYYISKVVSVKYTDDINRFIQSIIFLYLYGEHKKREDINSSHFLIWSSELFRKTNANDANIQNIKTTLNKWGEDIGIHSKFKREASRINYKKAIFLYFVLSIQYYNK